MTGYVSGTWNCIKMNWDETFPFIPILAYVLLCILTLKRQMQQIPEKRHPVLDTRATTNLTLVGFSFAVISLIVTLFKDQIGQVSYSLFLFSIGLSCFFGSYVLLYLRLRRCFDTISDGLTNSGIWTILWGMRELFISFKCKELEKSSKLFSVLIFILLLYIAIDIFWKWRDRNEGV